MGDRLYHPAAYDPRPVDSYWRATAAEPRHGFPPLSGSTDCDIAIMGAGYTGLSAALALARDHGADVRVLEAATPGWGASGRNGGFCCMGSAKLSFPDMAKRYGEDGALAFLRAQREAVEHVGGFLDAHGLAADMQGDGELCLAHKGSRAGELEEDAVLFERVHGLKARRLDKADLAGLGASGPEFHAGLHLPVGFGLHPLRYLRALADAAADAGVQIHGDSAVSEWRQEAGLHRLRTPGGEVRAKKVILAVNGYGSESLPPWLMGRRLPALSSIIVTRPLSEAELAGQGWTSETISFDTRNLLHYFRLLPDRRFLFGGRGGTDASPEGLSRRRKILRADFDRMFPAWRNAETEYFWSGLVCLAYDLVPYAGEIGGMSNAWAAFAYHGNGVAMASWTGARLAGLVAGEAGAREKLPLVMRGPSRTFPLPALRLGYLRAAYAGFTLKDEWL